MKVLLARLPWLLVLLLVVTGAARRAPQPKTTGTEENVVLFENRKVAIALPEGFELKQNQDPRGLVSVRITDQQEQISMEVSFLPDGEGRFMDAWAQKEFMNQVFQEYVAGSREQAMQFEILEPKVGRGTYCVFTDRKLAGKTELPPNEYLNVTTGVKAWPGVIALFTLFSNGTESREYRAAMAMLRESVHERIAPLR